MQILRYVTSEFILLLTTLKVYWVVDDLPEEIVDPEKDRLFMEAYVIFVGSVLSVLCDKLVDAYLHMHNFRELWNALESKFSAIDADSDLYLIEQFHDYKIVD